jgi:hypothetical protein
MSFSSLRNNKLTRKGAQWKEEAKKEREKVNLCCTVKRGSKERKGKGDPSLLSLQEFEGQRNHSSQSHFPTLF